MDDIFCPKHGHRYVFDYSADAAHPENQCVICIRDDNLALRARLAQVGQELAQANERHGHWAEMAERAHKETTARAEKAEQFREALIDALVINHSYTAEHDTDPRKAVADLIAVETQIALDPAVSGDAQTLIDRGRKEVEQENARLREALAAETERCAQVALSYWEYHKKAYLHHIGHWQAAADYHLQLQAAGSQIADRIRARTALGGE